MKTYLKLSVSAVALLAAVSLANAQNAEHQGAGGGSEKGMSASEHGGMGGASEKGGVSAQHSERGSESGAKGAAAGEKTKGASASEERSGSKSERGSSKEAQQENGRSSQEHGKSAQSEGRSGKENGESRAENRNANDKNERNAEQRGNEQRNERSAQSERNHERDQNGRTASGNEDRSSRNGERTTENREFNGGREGEHGRVNINVTPQEKTRIHQVIEHDSAVHVYHRNDVHFSVSVGTRIPESIEVYDVPPQIIQIDPDFRRYKIVVLDDEILVVDPVTREIVDVIET